jgi:hypothetical protein
MRVSIFCLKAREKGFVTKSLPSRPADQLRKRATTILALGETVDGKLWVDIEVISHSFCESDEPPKIKARGWVPAHDKIGAPTVWFSARGC